MTQAIRDSHLTYRPDIDGLRALAILLVIIFHAFPKFLRGGFIGVDIFFVISGYLITSIILKGQSQGNFSLLSFYDRRIRRIFPALIVVLGFCLVVGWYVLLANEYSLLGKHIAAGSVYLSNFLLKSEAGYFDTEAELKPLLHLWSLGIEEQFYLFFPVLLVVLNRLKFNALPILLVCLGISFILNVDNITDDQTGVFFYPQTRVWELLIGGVVAYANTHYFGLIAKFTIKMLPKNFGMGKLANLVAWFGVALIFVAWVSFNSKKILFPSWWALMPTIGAASLIVAGEKAWFNRKVLASKPAVFIGLISYPLYLWHWVLLTFIRITEIDKPSVFMLISVLVMSIVLAWATYNFIEKKVRFYERKFVSPSLLVGLLFIGLLGYMVYQKNGYPNRYTQSLNWDIGEIGNQVFVDKGLALQKSCYERYKAFTKTEFCLVQDEENPPTSILVGDSHANHLYAGLVANKSLTRGNLLNLGAGGCFPFFDNPLTLNKNCRFLINQVLEMAINTPSVMTVILSGRAVTELTAKNLLPKKSVDNYLSVNSDTAVNTDPYFIFQNGMKKTLQLLLSANKNVVFVLDIPDLEFDPVDCINRPWRLSGQAAKQPCAIPRSQVDNRRKKYLGIVEGILNQFPDVKVLDPLPALCDAEFCWAIKDRKMLYRDSNHLNEVGAVYLGEHMKFR